MRTLEEIIDEASKKGLIVANLFQLRTMRDGSTQGGASGEWQANFHHPTGWYDYGRGSSAVAALEDALARAAGHKGPENRPIPKTPIKIAEETSSLDDML